MRIAVVQFRPNFKDVPGNLRRLAKLVGQAAERGAGLCVLPELCTTGYSFLGKAAAEPYAESVSEFRPDTPGTGSMHVFYALARRYQMHIAWGLVERSVTGSLFNSQVLMAPDGSFESYSKINLCGNDLTWAQAGRANPPVRTIQDGVRLVRTGLLICRDIRDKSDDSPSFYEPGDADLIVMSAGWGRGFFPATAWMKFAKENRATLAVSNLYGEEANNDFGHGGIAIIRPDGEVIWEGLAFDQDCLVIGEI